MSANFGLVLSEDVCGERHWAEQLRGLRDDAYAYSWCKSEVQVVRHDDEHMAFYAAEWELYRRVAQEDQHGPVAMSSGRQAEEFNKSYIFTQCALKAQATAVLEQSYDPLQDQVLYANMSQNS